MRKFSIILPVRNGSNYLQPCVESILAQTYPDFELLVLENASTDNTLDILRSFRDERIKIIPAEKPLTIEENWARAIALPKAEYMTLIGHDDIVAPHFLEVINTLIQKYPDASLYHTHFNFIDGKGKVIRKCKPMPPKLQQHELLEGFLRNKVDSMGTGYVMRSADYDKTGGIPVNYPGLLFADFDLWLTITGLRYEVVAPDNAFAFRVHQSATTSSADTRLHKGLETFVHFLAELRLKSQMNNDVIKKHAAGFLMQYAKSYSHRILRTPKNKRSNTSVQEFINFTKQLANELSVMQNFHPEKDKSIRLAKRIDESRLLSKLFLLIREKYGKPFIG